MDVVVVVDLDHSHGEQVHGGSEADRQDQESCLRSFEDLLVAVQLFDHVYVHDYDHDDVHVHVHDFVHDYGSPLSPLFSPLL